MARYIEADKLLEELQEEIDFESAMYTEEQNEWFKRGLKCAFKDAKNQPTADVEEVRRGEWKLKSEIRQLLDDVDEKFYVECPICHRIEWIPYILTEGKMLEYANEHYPYCHCGAKMDGGKKE